MRVRRLHAWRVDAAEAVRIQKRLKERVVLTCPLASPRFVAAADASYEVGGTRMWAAVVVYDVELGCVVEEAGASGRMHFPYRPGLLTFREGPILLEAFRKLHTEPDVALFDGQGVLHPRGMGLATHMGLWLDKPSVGCAKKALYGKVGPLGSRMGDTAPIRVQGRVAGYAVRTRSGVKPVFVSPGHLMDPRSAVQLVLRCHGGTRIPEPLRRAHHAANALRRKRAG